MDTKDLRTGNYYLCRGELVQMDDITLSNILRYGGEMDYEGVPIADEVLSRLGFTGKSHYFTLDQHTCFHATEHEGWCFNYKENSQYNSRGIHIWVKYIHNIQDIISLLDKKELTLKEVEIPTNGKEGK